MSNIPKAETIDAVLAREAYWKNKAPATKKEKAVYFRETAVHSASTR